MAADSTGRRGSKSGLSVRPQVVSDKSYMESVVGFFHEVVPHAYSNSTKQEDKETILWVKFESSDINDADIQNGNTPSLLVVLGYTNGVQIWCISANGEGQEVLSWRQGPVRALKLLTTPQPVFGSQDLFVSKRPLVALCDSSSAGQQYCSVNFVSLKTGDQIHCIKFKTPILDIHCNKRVLVVTFQERITVFDSSTFRDLFTITGCYPSPGPNVNPIALGTRWLAFADKKLVPLHQTCGGMAGDGVQSYAATVIHAAKTITKGLTVFGETVATSLTGHKAHGGRSPSKKESKSANKYTPGIVTVVDIQCVPTRELNTEEDTEGEGIIAHFPAHANEPIAAMSFDPSGMLLLTACKLGHNFNIFRIFSHPASSSLGAVHHLYTLHRGDTTAKVQEIAFSLDTRWVAVSTLRGTTHIFPLTPYGGPVSVRTHTSPRVVNQLSRFHKSAGLEEIQQPSPTGRSSPVLSASPGSPGAAITRSPDIHPSVVFSSTTSGRMGNPRLPPYPHPTTIFPLSQIKQPLSFPLTSLSSGSAPKSPSVKGRTGNTILKGNENISVAATFSPPRAWLVGSPSLAREKRTDKRVLDSLFIIGCHGNLTEYSLEPRVASGQQKVTEESPIELEVMAQAQWNLQRLHSSAELRPPLLSTNPLIIASENFVALHSGKDKKQDSGISYSSALESGKDQEGQSNTKEDIEDSWLSQVEIITHAGPPRRLWMGPQFTFKTFHHSSNTTVLSSTSSALLSDSPEISSSTLDFQPDGEDLHSIRPVRSSPMTMPGDHQTHSKPSASPVLIEATCSWGSFEQHSGILEVCGGQTEVGVVAPPPGKATKERGQIEDKLRESLADAMIETPARDTTTIDPPSNTEFQGSYEELSSSSSGCNSHNYDARNSTPQSMEHVLVFPGSGGSPESP
ncbi:breast carcinoma-amplified sequence 3-like isoform X1 [Limulus polyphemus]|uniref:Breast carcinoma-amplified sequence 3-like isoform X1 n=1 Tax=Limulus polyphemus TaxID=6850 RepID=A0ABM1TRH7_LIMPO|nr:breast carcinoma-amplified sequence 3-like isoform X1 [Limulus polyphemus]XP_022258483.1 breast carcinoma-amplified sequence 3-like isoform X1 [Limulus polyphemus]XP_022258484.1 breast carcinoma-amplified sequence 3-like isoform X1 [Limulus polyphemus]